MDRVHLVIDANVNSWVQQLFLSAEIKNKKEIADPPKHTKEEQLQIMAHLRNMNTEISIKLADEIEASFLRR